MGDGHAQDLKHKVFRLLYTHGIQQEDYCKWKLNLLNGKCMQVKLNGYAQTDGIIGRSPSFMIDNLDVMDKLDIIKNITWQSLAISWMDDGHIYKKCNGGTLWSFAYNKELSIALSEKLLDMGVENKILENRNYFRIALSKSSVTFLSKNIAQYIHPSLAYKICTEYRHLVGTYKWTSTFPNYTVKPFTKKEYIDKLSNVYDIEVSDNHNFVVSMSKTSTSQLVVHNCQNLTQEQLKMCIGRLGKDSIMVFCGDDEQIDLKKQTPSAIKLIDKLRQSNSVGIIKLIENHRHPAVKELLTLLNS